MNSVQHDASPEDPFLPGKSSPEDQDSNTWNLPSFAETCEGSMIPRSTRRKWPGRVELGSTHTVQRQGEAPRVLPVIQVETLGHGAPWFPFNSDVSSHHSTRGASVLTYPLTSCSRFCMCLPEGKKLRGICRASWMLRPRTEGFLG